MSTLSVSVDTFRLAPDAIVRFLQDTTVSAETVLPVVCISGCVAVAAIMTLYCGFGVSPIAPLLAVQLA